MTIASAAGQPATPSGVAAPPTKAYSLISGGLAAQQQARQRYGLSTDAGHVARLQTLAGADTSLLGMPLDPDEVREMQRREVVGESLGRLENTLRPSLGDSYAGAWLDQADGGVAVVAVAGPTAGVASRAKAALPAGAAVKVVRVAASEKDLTSLQAAVEGAQAAWAARGISIAGTGTYLQENLVRVTLAAGSSASQVKAIKDAFNKPWLDVTVAPANAGLKADRYALSGPLYGGMRIQQPVSGGTVSCTSSTSAVGSSTGKSFGITAGHCGQAGNWYQGSTAGNGLGTGYSGDNGFFKSSTASPTSCDCTDFGPITNKQTNSVIVNGGGLYTYGNYASVSSNYYVGRPACVSGQTTNAVICDQIRTTSATFTGTEFGHTGKMINEIQIYCSAAPGDSGAPLGNGPTWLGVLSSGGGAVGACGSTGTISNYSRVQFLRSVTGDTPSLPAQ